MRRDPTTPDTRLADDPMAYNPATVGTLVHLMLGGLPPKHQGEVLQARVRYFDPIRRRPACPRTWPRSSSRSRTIRRRWSWSTSTRPSRGP